MKKNKEGLCPHCSKNVGQQVQEYKTFYVMLCLACRKLFIKDKAPAAA